MKVELTLITESSDGEGMKTKRVEEIITGRFVAKKKRWILPGNAGSKICTIALHPLEK